ncbi:hypothetical protein I4U23_004367 [Adineta vaga]|nr:hypothetical protein I4U23_004367 [Adineta vaga]
MTVIYGTLTIRENIMFAANTRHGTNVSLEERTYRVRQLIEQLGLTNRADTKIGLDVSIARNVMELFLLDIIVFSIHQPRYSIF